ncbi:MAG: putative transporter [Candidatus Eisenbacteria bacterium]|jgi:putative transport protein|nr:putative transporter [Candidatus Eisenbacteria bacterium]
MTWIQELLTQDSIAHAILVLAIVGATGLGLGSITVRGISLGVGGILFSGLLFGHLGLSIHEGVLEFIREFGLILFVYSIGLQVGPGFFQSLRRQGLSLNLLAASVVVLGVGAAVIIAHVAHLEMPVVVGLLSGATTNTPSLGAAQQALKDIQGLPAETTRLPSLGYAIAYPFGILGVIMTMVLMRFMFRINVSKEAEEFEEFQEANAPQLDTINVEVKNPNLDGLTLAQLPGVGDEIGVVVSRLLRAGRQNVPQPSTIIRLGDVLHAVGGKDRLKQLQLIVGSESALDVSAIPSSIIFKRIIVTRKAALGKTIDELGLRARYGVTITRIARSNIEFTPTRRIRLLFADVLFVVGEEGSVQAAARELGDSVKELNHPHVVSVFVGIFLGVVIGSWPVFFPGMPAPVRLGLAGGPLLVAIFLSRIRQVGGLVWYMPVSASFMLRELGIAMFLACVGLRGGDQFVETLLHGGGMTWMAWAAIITFVPIMLVSLIGRLVCKLDFVTLTGLLSGSMTDPPALAFANTMIGSDAPSISYATVYPLVMILRVLSTQLLVILLMA